MPPAKRETVPYDGDRIKAPLDEGIRDKVYPGAVWAVRDGVGTSAHGTTGVLGPDEPDVPMRADTVFAAASLTKVLAVWSSSGALGSLPLALLRPPATLPQARVWGWAEVWSGRPRSV